MSVAQGTKTTRYRVWQAIRIYRRFTTEDLVALGGMKAKSIRNYVYFLKRVGILKALSDGYTMLVRDVGPLVPVERPDGKLHDPNSDRSAIRKEARVLCAQRLGCLNCTRCACGDCPRAKHPRTAKEARHG